MSARASIVSTRNLPPLLLLPKTQERPPPANASLHVLPMVKHTLFLHFLPVPLNQDAVAIKLNVSTSLG